MAMYAIAVTPLINYLHRSQPDISQVWFPDDTTAAGQLAPFLQWWKLLLSQGPFYGYNPNAIKTYLIVKPQFLDSATTLFQGSNVQITCLGHRHLRETRSRARDQSSCARFFLWLGCHRHVGLIVTSFIDVS